MSEKPIPFVTPMVEAVLDGRKTQTRRVVKPQPVRVFGPAPYRLQEQHDLPLGAAFMVRGDAVPHGGAALYRRLGDGKLADLGGSRYVVGDVLWVRETWGTIRRYDHLPPRALPNNAAIGFRTDPPSRWCQTGCNGAAGKWRPGMFLPRRFARLFLRVTAVRVERLQEISKADAIAEGFVREPALPIDPRDWFRNLWDSLNARRGFGWDVDPWVWVYTFERCEAPRAAA